MLPPVAAATLAAKQAALSARLKSFGTVLVAFALACEVRGRG
jgi:hypothetical protein